MSGGARVQVDAATVSPSRSLAMTARLAPLVVVTDRCYREMVDELGDADAVVRHIARIATDLGKPIGVNLTSGPDASSTVFIGPKHWSDERVAGWIGRHREALERQFGDATFSREMPS